MGCSLPGSLVLGAFQARILEWVAISFCRGSSGPKDWTQVSCIAGRFFTDWDTREAPLFLPKSTGAPSEWLFPLYSALSSLEECPVQGTHFILMFLFKGGTAAQRLLVFLIECASCCPLGVKWPSLAPYMLHQQLNLHRACGALQGPPGSRTKTESSSWSAGSVDMEWMGHASRGNLLVLHV